MEGQKYSFLFPAQLRDRTHPEYSSGLHARFVTVAIVGTDKTPEDRFEGYYVKTGFQGLRSNYEDRGDWTRACPMLITVPPVGHPDYSGPITSDQDVEQLCADPATMEAIGHKLTEPSTDWPEFAEDEDTPYAGESVFVDWGSDSEYYEYYDSDSDDDPNQYDDDEEDDDDDDEEDEEDDYDSEEDAAAAAAPVAPAGAEDEDDESNEDQYSDEEQPPQEQQEDGDDDEDDGDDDEDDDDDDGGGGGGGGAGPGDEDDGDAGDPAAKRQKTAGADDY